MTKSQLIEKVASRLPHLGYREVENIVNTVFGKMADALRQGHRIEIRGFGVLGVKVRPARLGRNPKTGVKVQVPERRSLFFIVGKELRERLNRQQTTSLSSAGPSDGIGAAEAPVAMAAASRG